MNRAQIAKEIVAVARIVVEFGKIFGLKFDPEKVMGNRGAYDDGKEHPLVELEK